MREAELNVVAKHGKAGFERRLEAKARARGWVDRHGDVLNAGVGDGVEVGFPRQRSSNATAGVLDAAFLPTGTASQK